ncbi:hypothetical protein M231_02727 [Tremella mesenterica]|uniref:Septation protein imp2 n=1 Tax=Tremella mesenterica TaxID=5217 RepID=A0A4Q1BQ56_TREME|nr:uncharacterized protein TREMEDRAFT_68555 [Tremella mesenterica DSM 1558]EIW70224.1 hypothetical protein TREMEDRAFT_68555 [Tremella mesenterica DSM 1558]RXK39932.1 hypothetical protein M231_02727 [Tremella mesenterica]
MGDPYRSQSTTSLSRLYNGANGGGPTGVDGEELNDPSLDFCNAFWGPGDKGFDVVMARLRGAARTTDELRTYWKERVAIEEEYAKKLAKLAKMTVGKDEIGELAAAIQNLQTETASQASYHQALSTEMRQSVEQPTVEFGVRLTNLKKGLQASVEKSYKNKGLQEAHVQKAKDRYESDCLKLNSYTANAALSQGKDLEKIHSKLERVRQTIGANEQDFRQFVKVLEGTQVKWENEWKSFCDHVQDLEEDRLALMKDIMWAYANAVSQVCVEDDSSCERIREKLEQFDPQNDMINFVRGWGTGDTIPDPPRFINYSAGETYPSHPSTHIASFRRISSKPPVSATSQHLDQQAIQPAEAQPSVESHTEQPETDKNDKTEPQSNGWTGGMDKLALSDEQTGFPQKSDTKPPFGGIALPGMTTSSSGPVTSPSERKSTMLPPPVPPTMTMPEPRIPSRQSTRDATDTDPMAKALAELRREPPSSGSVRRNASHRRPESTYTPGGSVRGSISGQGVKSPASPAPTSTSRMSYQAPFATRASIDMSLSPPAPGHTAAQLQKSMDDFHRQATKRQSINYANYADDVVGAHPASRPTSPAPGSRGPASAMMQPPMQPPSPVADEVLSQYHQAFPGERSRSRAGSIRSGRSRAGSMISQQPPTSPSAIPREGFVGIGAGGGRSASPQPPTFRTPSPSPVSPHGILGPQNLGIALDEKGGVAHDSMAEAYRRQYQQQQQPSQLARSPSPAPVPIQSPSVRGSTYGPPSGQYSSPPQQYQGYGSTKSPVGGLPPSISQQTRPTSQYAPQQGYQTSVAPPVQQYPQHPPPQTQTQSQPPPQSQLQSPVQSKYQNYQQGYPYQQQQQQQQYQPPPQSTSPQPTYQQNGYGQRQSAYGAPQQYAPPQQTYRAPSPQPQQSQAYQAPSPQPQPQPQHPQAYKAASPQPQGDYYRGGPSPQPQGYASQGGRSPSPQPNRPPENTAPTGQWSTTGQPVLFYVKALYDYTAQSPAEFHFQAGDIIAVTSTPEDGWWSGELLDEARRVPGRTDFPSNL